MRLHRIGYLIFTLQPLLLAGMGNCPDGSPGTTVVFVNGINTTESGAAIASQVLAAKLNRVLTLPQQECNQVTYKWNLHGSLGPISFLGDLYESARQLVGDDISRFLSWLSNLDDAPTAFKVLFETAATQVDESEYVNITDLADHVHFYQNQINNDRNMVIVVSHSQGNWFANESYRIMRDGGMALPDSSKFNIVGVASPASTVEGYTAGQEKYTTLCEDFIWKVPGALTNTLTNNALLCAVSKLTPLLDPAGIWKHDFSASYLADGTNSEPVILGQIVEIIPKRRPAISVAPSPYNFGPIILGSSGQKVFTIQNTGNATLSISNITSSPGFSLLLPSFPINILGGSSATFTVLFFPGSTVGLQQSTINVYSNASGSPTQIAVSGTGIVPPPPAPTCTLTANPLTINQVQFSTLSWTTTNNPTSGSIAPGVGSVNLALGSINVSPTANTTYTLTVSNANPVQGSCQATVAVNNPTSLTAMPTARAWLGAAAIGTTIYTAGGGRCQPLGCDFFGANELNTVEAYDAVGNAWSSKTPLTSARFDLASLTLNGKAYAVGGTFSFSSAPLGSVEVYDPFSNTWASKAPLNTPRWKLTAATNGKVYAIGVGAI